MRVESLSGETLEKEGLLVKPGYGIGIGFDLKAFLTESSQAERVLGFLDQRERFVLLSYFLLRKTEKQIADLVGMSEYRLNLFLKGTMKKLGALVAFSTADKEAWGEVLEKQGLRRVRVRKVRRGKATRAEETWGEADLLDCFVLFLGMGSFLKVGETLLIYYVDVRRSLERAAEKLLKERDPAAMIMGEFINATIQFASVRGEGYAGKAGRMQDETLEATDQKILGEEIIKLEDGVEGILIPRAVGACGNGGDSGAEDTSGQSDVPEGGDRLAEGAARGEFQCGSPGGGGLSGGERVE